MIVALNNKSNLDKNEFISYLDNLKRINTNSTLILCPTYLNIPLVGTKTFGKGKVQVTSTLSGVKYSIVGHSERREYQKETNEDIKEKIIRLIENDITPILCIGESKIERDNNTYKEVLIKELSILEDVDKDIIIAYEPIWSIGTGVIPTNEEVMIARDTYNLKING